MIRPQGADLDIFAAVMAGQLARVHAREGDSRVLANIVLVDLARFSAGDEPSAPSLDGVGIGERDVLDECEGLRIVDRHTRPATPGNSQCQYAGVDVRGGKSDMAENVSGIGDGERAICGGGTVEDHGGIPFEDLAVDELCMSGRQHFLIQTVDSGWATCLNSFDGLTGRGRRRLGGSQV